MSVLSRIYLDNAATSWPKPQEVSETIAHYLKENGAPAGRGSYRAASEVDRAVERVRQSIAELIHAESSKQIVFGSSGTDALNTAIQGALRPGDHVVTTVCEHNSVLRPLHALTESLQIQVDHVPCDAAGRVRTEDVLRATRSNTRLVAMIHASNVTGMVQPVAEVGAQLRDRETLFLVDAAQSLGHLEVDVASLGADLLAAPGHKGLLGPLGTGLLYMRPGVETMLRPFRYGGTGTSSDSEIQPETMPSKFEAGNLNVPGILGLGAGIAYLTQRTITAIQTHEHNLLHQLLKGLQSVKEITMMGGNSCEHRTGTVSFTLNGADPHEVAMILDSQYGIECRAGFHCAPRMHEALGTTANGGTVRLSVGHAITETEIERTIEAVQEIAATLIG